MGTEDGEALKTAGWMGRKEAMELDKMQETAVDGFLMRRFGETMGIVNEG